jgi:hypothetical protein
VHRDVVVSVPLSAATLSSSWSLCGSVRVDGQTRLLVLMVTLWPFKLGSVAVIVSILTHMVLLMLMLLRWELTVVLHQELCRLVLYLLDLRM